MEGKRSSQSHSPSSFVAVPAQPAVVFPWTGNQDVTCERAFHSRKSASSGAPALTASFRASLPPHRYRCHSWKNATDASSDVAAHEIHCPSRKPSDAASSRSRSAMTSDSVAFASRRPAGVLAFISPS